MNTTSTAKLKKPPPTLDRLAALRAAADIARTLVDADINIIEVLLTGSLGRSLRQKRPRRLVGDIDLILVVADEIWDFYCQTFDLPIDYPTSKRVRLAAACDLVRAQSDSPLLLSPWTSNPSYWIQVAPPGEDSEAYPKDDQNWSEGARPLLDIFVLPQNWAGSRLNEAASHAVQCNLVPGELTIQGPTNSARKLLANLARDAAPYSPATNGFVVPGNTLF